MSLLEFLPAALQEYVEAVRWYARQRQGLGEELIDEVEYRIRRAVEMPGAGRLEPDAPERFALRWYNLHRFPYALLIGNLDTRRVVVAVAHERRKPGYWKRRLLDSDQAS